MYFYFYNIPAQQDCEFRALNDFHKIEFFDDYDTER